MSFTVMSPRSSQSPLITSTRSRRWRCMRALASSSAAPSFTVTSLSRGVMMFFTGWSRLVSKRRSRLVTMPTTRWPSSTGRPEMWWRRVISNTSRTVMVGVTVMGSFTTPLSKRLTFATSAACSAGAMFLCTMPMPPSCASAIARRDSVTVSMAAESSGMLSWIDRVRRVERLTSRGRTVEWAGTSSTSSKVSAFWMTRIQKPSSQNEIIQIGPRPNNRAPRRGSIAERFIDVRVNSR